uniref:Peptidase A1 domain-containing protein n=1 Tax=Plectus sambesii TaxID=2011161 RepID=A0A914VWS7_9BILA
MFVVDSTMNRLGDTNGQQLCIPNTYFGQATHISNVFTHDLVDGVFGLGFTSLAVGGVTPPLINAIDQDLLSLPLVSVDVFPGTFTLGQQNISAGFQAISDTGTSFIGGPKSVIDQLASAVNAVYNSSYEAYFMDCSQTPPDVVFTIGGHLYRIQPKNYIRKLDNTICEFTVFAFAHGGFGPNFILGDPFIRQYCNIYDIGRGLIGFARSLT